MQPIIEIIDDDDHHHDYVHHDRHDHPHDGCDDDDDLERDQPSLLPDEGAQRAADAEDGQAQEETNPEDNFLTMMIFSSSNNEDDYAKEETNLDDHFLMQIF